MYSIYYKKICGNFVLIKAIFKLSVFNKAIVLLHFLIFNLHLMSKAFSLNHFFDKNNIDTNRLSSFFFAFMKKSFNF